MNLEQIKNTITTKSVETVCINGTICCNCPVDCIDTEILKRGFTLIGTQFSVYVFESEIKKAWISGCALYITL